MASADPTADPLIDPNYYATEADRVVVRAGMRMSMRAFETEPLAQHIAAEVPPAGFPPLSSASSDAELDVRIRRAAATWFHPSGSASMGKVVDTQCRLLGVDRLRVVDASVFPTPIGAHYQVAVYALAEQMADIISGREV